MMNSQHFLRLSILYVARVVVLVSVHFFSVYLRLFALVYCGLCIAGCVVFDTYLGAFILGCNAAFGINYYANEKLADVQVI